MKKIAYLLLFSLFIGCKSDMDKSIFEPLTIEELNKLILKDARFAETYDIIEDVKVRTPLTDVEKARFYKLTYARVHEVVILYQDTTFMSEIKLKDRGKSKVFEKALNETINKKDPLVMNFFKYLESKND